MESTSHPAQNDRRDDRRDDRREDRRDDRRDGRRDDRRDGRRNNRWEIVPAHWRDLNALRRVEKACFPVDIWPLWDLIGVLTLPNIIRLKAVVGEEMIGFVGADVRPGEGRALIATVGVLPEYRGLGIGTALMVACEAAMTGIRSVSLNVRMSNRMAIEMYEKLDYRVISRWPGYYQDGEDALVMEKRLL